MGESTKSVWALLVIVGIIVAVFAWTTDHPGSTTRRLRVGAPVTAVLALGLLLKLQYRADLECDYLRSVTGTYFNRNGFCFSFVVTPIDGIAFMDAYFQTQYERPSVGRIALRPVRGFFMTRAKINAITFDVECPPSGFGFARIAIPLPANVQGKRQSFEVGASVWYPEGQGRRIRFHDGVFLRADTKFGDSFGTALNVAGAATGSILLSKPATATVALPDGVAEDLPRGLSPEIKILWQRGDPPFENVA